MSKYLRFRDNGYSPSRKTRVWEVENAQDRGQLGTIKWHGAWRKYTFRPYMSTLFDAVCMREIADFCDQATRDHKATS